MTRPFATVAAVLALIRVRTCIAGATLCFVGAGLARTPDYGSRTIFAALSIAFLIAFAQAFNDVVDRHLDLIAKAHRPLPSGSISPLAAKLVVLACATGGMTGAIFAGPRLIPFATLLLGLSWLYSFRLKDTVLLGNIVVAALASSSVLFGATYGGITILALLAQAVVFSFSVAFEILKTGVDVAGDAAAGLTTVATRLGVRTTASLAGALCLLAGTVALTPALLTDHPVRYSAAMFLTAVVPTYISGLRLLSRNRDITDLMLPFGLMRFAWGSGVASLLLLL